MQKWKQVFCRQAILERRTPECILHLFLCVLLSQHICTQKWSEKNKNIQQETAKLIMSAPLKTKNGAPATAEVAAESTAATTKRSISFLDRDARGNEAPPPSFLFPHFFSRAWRQFPFLRQTQHNARGCWVQVERAVLTQIGFFSPGKGRDDWGRGRISFFGQKASIEPWSKFVIGYFEHIDMLLRATKNNF